MSVEQLDVGLADLQQGAEQLDQRRVRLPIDRRRRELNLQPPVMLAHDAFAPRGYPEIYYLTAPIRAAARKLGDTDGINLWAGSAYRHAQEGSASELVERWGHELAARRQ